MRATPSVREKLKAGSKFNGVAFVSVAFAFGREIKTNFMKYDIVNFAKTIVILMKI